MTEQPDEMKPGDEVPPGTESAGPAPCPACGGDGEVDGERCEQCDGTGEIEQPVGGG